MVIRCPQHPGCRNPCWNRAPCRQVVGVDLVVRVICHPHRSSVGPDPFQGFVVRSIRSIEILAGHPRLVTHVVGVDLVVSRVRHPHRRSVGPDAFRAIVPSGIESVEVLTGHPRLVTHVVGVHLAVRGICHPHRSSVGPDALPGYRFPPHPVRRSLRQNSGKRVPRWGR